MGRPRRRLSWLTDYLNLLLPSLLLIGMLVYSEWVYLV